MSVGFQAAALGKVNSPPFLHSGKTLYAKTVCLNTTFIPEVEIALEKIKKYFDLQYGVLR